MYSIKFISLALLSGFLLIKLIEVSGNYGCDATAQINAEFCAIATNQQTFGGNNQPCGYGGQENPATSQCRVKCTADVRK